MNKLPIIPSHIKKLGDSSLLVKSREFDLKLEREEASNLVCLLIREINLLSTLYDFSKGIGLSAPQIGYDRAVFVIRLPHDNDFVFINPKIVCKSEENSTKWEACLSFFEIRVRKTRPKIVKCAFYDNDFQFREQSFCEKDNMSRLVQHEQDHLNGILTLHGASIEEIASYEYYNNAIRCSVA